MERHDVSVNELSKTTGISRQSIYNTDETLTPHLQNIIKYSLFFNVKVDEFIGLVSLPTTLNKINRNSLSISIKTEEMLDNFKKFLYNLKSELELGVDEFSELIKLKKDTVHSLLHHDNYPSFETLSVICNDTGILMDDILNYRLFWRVYKFYDDRRSKIKLSNHGK